MTTTSSALLDTPVRSRKRRYSALDFLSLQPTPPDQTKRPRILIVDEEDSARASPDFPQGSATTAEAIESSDTLGNDSDTESASSSGSSTSEDASDSSESATQEGIDEIEGGSLASNEKDDSTSSSSSSSDSETGLPLSTPTPGAPATRLPVLGPRRASSTSSSRSQSTSGPSGALQARLRSFLPELHAANARLEAARQAGTLSAHHMELAVDAEADGDADDERPELDPPAHIEMELGLGVLEEKRAEDEASSSSSSSASSVVDEDEGMLREEKVSDARPRGKEKQVLRRLMGQGKVERPEIRVVDEDE